MKYLAEELDERNLGQVIKWTRTEKDGPVNCLAVAQEIYHYPDQGLVTVVTADNYVDFQYGEEVETEMSIELRMARIITNVVTGLESATTEASLLTMGNDQ